MRIKLLSEHAIKPTKGSVHAAGYDLYSTEDVSIPSCVHHLIKTNISIEIPEGFYGRIAPRSGLAYKNGIDVLAGVIDSDYRGDIGVILMNHGDEPFQVSKGDRIAQIIIEKHYDFPLTVVKEIEETNRGEGGFGSTGR
jgi:dUTP pyrophosphatase